MQNTAAQLWSEVLSVLKKDITAQSFETWLKPSKALEITDEVLTIEVPNKFFREWLLDHYYDVITNIIDNISKKKLRVDFVVAKTTSPGA